MKKFNIYSSFFKIWIFLTAKLSCSSNSLSLQKNQILNSFQYKQNKKNLLVETAFIPELKETVEINAYNIIKFNLTTIEALIKEKNYRIIAPYYDEHICKRFVCKDSLIHMNYINHIIATKCIENNPK